MVRDRRIEGLDYFIMERRQSRAHLGQFEHLSMADGCIRINDRMQALALCKARIDDGRQAPEFQGKTNVSMSDEDTRHELTSGSRDDGLADRLLKLSFPS